MKTRLVVALLFRIGCGLAFAAEPAGGETVFTGARLIDGTGRAPVENSVLVIRGERIVAAGPDSQVAVTAGATFVNVRGRTIIPGLISAHSHLGLTRGASTALKENYIRENVAAQLAQYEFYGVTAVLSLGANNDILYTWRDEQRKGRLPGADIFTADRGLGVPNGAPPFPLPGDQVYRPTTPDEARAAVREMAARNPDILKLWLDDLFGKAPRMQPEIFQAAIAEAHAAIDEGHRHGLRMAAHIFYLADAKALLGAGVDVIAHSVRDQPVDAAFIQAMKAQNAAYIPTLDLDESQFIFAEHPAYMDTPFFIKAVEPALLATWLSPGYAAKMRANPNTPKNRAALEVGMKNLKVLHDAGVRIAFGTDSGAMPTRIAGFAEHRELQLMVQAGLTPMEAIGCATRESAKVLGAEKERGTLEAGKLADFLILQANPLDDIRNTEKIEEVWHRGKVIK